MVLKNSVRIAKSKVQSGDCVVRVEHCQKVALPIPSSVIAIPKVNFELRIAHRGKQNEWLPK